MSSDTDTLVDALSDGEYEYVSVDALHPHPENSEVYGEIDPEESFIEDIRRNGVETPLIVNEHPDTEAEWDLPNTVIGGHRRLEAARRVGLAAVPVKWESYPEPLATRRLILNNLQRDKNDAQETREMLTLEDTAREMTGGAGRNADKNCGKFTTNTRRSMSRAVGGGSCRETTATRTCYTVVILALMFLSTVLVSLMFSLCSPIRRITRTPLTGMTVLSGIMIILATLLMSLQ